MQTVTLNGHHNKNLSVEVSDLCSVVSLSMTNQNGESMDMSCSRQQLEQLARDLREALNNPV